MKTRNLFIATILIFIAIIITQNSTFLIGFEFQSLLTDILGILFFACIGLTIYSMIRNIFRAIKSIVTKGSTKNQTSRKLQNIDRALDEIETTLDAMTQAGQEDGKITPIWGAGTKKDR